MKGIHALAYKTMGLAAAAGAVGLVYGLLWAKELAWRAGPIRHTALAITVAGALGRCLIPRGSRPKR